MRTATYCSSLSTDRAYATGYDQDAGAIGPTHYLSMTHPGSARALCMSVPDFLRWQAALTSGRVLPAAT